MKVNRLGDCVHPEHRLAIALLERAARDARRGSIEAAMWLLTDGVTYAEALSPDSSDALLRLVEDVASDLEAGTLGARYPRLDGYFYEQLTLGREVTSDVR